MAQDPNIPKIKIGGECGKQVESLASAFEELIKATNPGRGLIALGTTYSSMKAAKEYLAQAEQKAIISEEDVNEIYALIGEKSPEFPLKTEDIRNLFTNLKQSAVLTLEALLNAAVDCECREAKAAYDQLRSAALQTVLEGKGGGDGRPRRYTEIPGEEVPSLLRPGAVAMVYEDPISKAKPEGEARLIKCLISAGQDLEYWTVEFLSDNSRVDRWIDATKG